jgi:hypothetical protein
MRILESQAQEGTKSLHVLFRRPPLHHVPKPAAVNAGPFRTYANAACRPHASYRTRTGKTGRTLHSVLFSTTWAERPKPPDNQGSLLCIRMELGYGIHLSLEFAGLIDNDESLMSDTKWLGTSYPPPDSLPPEGLENPDLTREQCLECKYGGPPN